MASSGYQQIPQQPQPMYFLPHDPQQIQHPQQQHYIQQQQQFEQQQFLSKSPQSPAPAAAAATPNQKLLINPDTPRGFDPESTKQYLLSREYEVHTTKWIGSAWNCYKQCWWGYSGILFLIIVSYWVPYVGPLLSWPLALGYFISASHSIRSGEAVVCTHLVSGYLYYGPALVIGIFYSLAVSIGFLFLIIPGLYLWVALAFSLGVYLEYQQNGIRILEAMRLSAGVVNKRFCSVACFLIINALFSFSGVLLFGIGIFITTPVSLIAIAYAFEDIFGMNRERHPDTSCVCC